MVVIDGAFSRLLVTRERMVRCSDRLQQWRGQRYWVFRVNRA
jgi:hypothetical protein